MKWDAIYTRSCSVPTAPPTTSTSTSTSTTAAPTQSGCFGPFWSALGTSSAATSIGTITNVTNGAVWTASLNDNPRRVLYFTGDPQKSFHVHSNHLFVGSHNVGDRVTIEAFGSFGAAYEGIDGAYYIDGVVTGESLTLGNTSGTYDRYILRCSQTPTTSTSTSTTAPTSTLSERINPVMTGPTSPSGAATESSFSTDGFGHANEGWRAFDGLNGHPTTNSNTWVSVAPLPQWVCYEFATAKRIRHYKLTQSADLYPAPVGWTLEGSNNGTTWTTLHTVAGQTGWAGPYPQALITVSYDFENANTYTHYRVNVNSTGGVTNYVGIGEIGFYERT